jgi:hypothetical protein
VCANSSLVTSMFFILLPPCHCPFWFILVNISYWLPSF